MISFIALCACQVLHIVDFLGSRRMETAPTSIEGLLRPTQSQSDEPSDLRGSLSPTTRHPCTMSKCIRHLAVPGGHPSSYEPGATLLNFSDRADTDETTPYSIHCSRFCSQRPSSHKTLNQCWFDVGPTSNQHGCHVLFLFTVNLTVYFLKNL